MLGVSLPICGGPKRATVHKTHALQNTISIPSCKDQHINKHIKQKHFTKFLRNQDVKFNNRAKL